MQCSYFDAGRCRSCTLMGHAYATQLAGKQAHCQEVLADFPMAWSEPVTSPESGFRNKAKMVVGGNVAAPTLGILDRAGHGVDLSDCGLYPPELSATFAPLAAFITRAGLEPYDVPGRRGQLKYVIVTVSPDGELMVRFVVRTAEVLGRIRAGLGWLREQLPSLAVLSANIHPEHKAVLEGAEEIILTDRDTLPMVVNRTVLHLRPRSFFQTNTVVAAALYRQATQWLDEIAPATVWDLYCGVGGFALHAAGPGRSVLGVETSAEAIDGARRSATELGLSGVRFEVGDAGAFAVGGHPAGLAGPAAAQAPDLVIVNPPRRGIGPELAGWLESSEVRSVLYSSCRAESLARDLAAMPSLLPRRARVLDMFPQTDHYEVLVELRRA
ncbi:23S rRNA (uracil(747)-C(5))-methyltransferase RlmC [Occultella glacieicola]|uniref:23S rRNA (Uracil(747)-C(5))-methyltransferase RlmC n=1 Tax=Occultella glacieicola TaxID=2518684 RepID=A0ABY2E1V3_9MICO|nr:23S rRNA (uracil(747)-C(5))-methyltransferase RlmC [Occultella glacieicola]TDE92579.1 23S rRNA (uracil(747)-C(5))-methyltransferase RlmC [Occultella glacieicola]